MEPRLTIAIWGKRPDELYGYDRERYVPFRESVQELIEALTVEKKRVVRVLTGGAQGTDQIAFWAAERARLRGYPVENVVYVPFPGQPGKWSEDGPFGKKEYELMLAHATEVFHVFDADDVNKMEAYRKRNEALVDQSDLQFVFYRSNTVYHVGSGTLRAIEYAKRHHKVPWVFDLDKQPERDER